MPSIASRSLTVWLLAMAFWFVPAEVRASGGVELLPLKHALARAAAVFVVERGDPFQYDVRLLRQPPKRHGCDTDNRSITYLSLTIREALYLRSSDALLSSPEFEANPPVKRCWFRPSTEPKRYRMELPTQPSELLWLIDSEDAQNINLTWVCVKSGGHKIPIYERLEGGLMPDAVVAGRQYLLLAQPAADYQSYEGIGGWGLLDVSKRDAVERLLQEERHDEPLTSAAWARSIPEGEPSTTEDGEILEAAFRYAMAEAGSVRKREAMPVCLQLVGEADLPPDFVRRFGKVSWIKNASGCAMSVRDGRAVVIDRMSQRPAMKLGIQSIRRVSKVIAVVVVGQMQDGNGPQLREYVLGRPGSRWVVMRSSAATTR